MKHICIALVRFYQKYLSPLKGRPCCRFTPTCSAYAIDAFRKRGFFVGMILTVWRIFRCQPLCPGGYDPVPDKGFRNPKIGQDDGENSNDTASVVKKKFVFKYNFPLERSKKKSKRK